MTAADRQRLKQLVDQGRRDRIARERLAGRGRPCAGCGGDRARYTVGCVTCRDRRNGRGKRAREARAKAAA